MITSSLYVHIPFCIKICNYCDFCKVFYNEELVDNYLLALEKELTNLEITNSLKTVYIGGGTPSCLNAKQLEKLLKILEPYISSDTLEYCMELNPETMDKQKVELLKKYHISRVSIGVQTFNENILNNIDRVHTKEEVFQLISWLQEYEINNISIDMMYGLPNQTKKDVVDDLDICSTLGIKHISYYSLILEEHTKLYNSKYEGLDQLQEYQIQTFIDLYLEKLGYEKYEVSNYAKKGFESKHNSVYWKYQNYYAIGAGATSKIDHKIIENSKNVFGYTKQTTKSNIIDNSVDDIKFNHIMMSLRLLEGLDIIDFNRRYNCDFLNDYSHILNKLIADKLLYVNNNKLFCSKESIYHLHDILLEFL